jgi:hypothetical protein
MQNGSTICACARAALLFGSSGTAKAGHSPQAGNLQVGHGVELEVVRGLKTSGGSAMSVENRTSTVTINAAFLQEIKEVNEDLWKLLDDVKRLCTDAQGVQQQGRRVVELLAELRDQLAMHFALEEAYGYFVDPVHVAPQLSVTATALRDEHAVLYAGIRDLADEVDELQRAGTLPKNAPRVVERFRDYYDQFQRHENRENELILEAYDSDIGVGD